MDLIERQAAIDAIRSIKANYCETADDQILLIDKDVAMTELMMLPSAQPERKKGKWIECDTSEHWKCDQCGERAPMYWDGENMSYAEWLSNFCPDCGVAMMEVEQDDE